MEDIGDDAEFTCWQAVLSHVLKTMTIIFNHIYSKATKRILIWYYEYFLSQKRPWKYIASYFLKK